MASVTFSPELAPPLPAATAHSPAERRLRAEWDLLQQLVALNPTRLQQPLADDRTFHLTLSGTPALQLAEAGAPEIETLHRLRVEFPRFFPAVPLELYLHRPMQHPNIHPKTGFVCLWDRHQIANNIEHALHKTAAILGWQLLNPAAEHSMQPQAQSMIPRRAELSSLLAAPPLRGTAAPATTIIPLLGVTRKRLS